MQDSDAARKAQEERARRLMEQIKNLSAESAPTSPRDFVEKRMRELSRLKKAEPADAS